MQLVTTTEAAALIRALAQRRRELQRVEPEKWSQRALAERLGWSQSQLSGYESGKTRPTPDTLRCWAVGLGVDLTITYTLADEGGTP